jgi:phosphopantothenoylcysteine decarboxylase/phosphopantothenate--cysteine ligase
MHFLITAGPTREPIDPVRYISNRSSGRMGYALAEAALEAGHTVTLISGPVQIAAPQGAAVIAVETAQQMYDAVKSHLDQAQVAIFGAAVADYRPVQAATQKIKKHAEELTLQLERTPDILGSVRSSFGYLGLLCGFAAETNDLHAYATGKLQRKGCDVIVGNDVSQPGIGFDSQDNEVTLFYRDGRVQPLPRGSKLELARQIIQVMEELHS